MGITGGFGADPGRGRGSVQVERRCVRFVRPRSPVRPRVLGVVSKNRQGGGDGKCYDEVIAIVTTSVHIRGWTLVPAVLRSAVCGLGPAAVDLVRLQEKESKEGWLAIDGSSNRVNSSVEKALTWSPGGGATGGDAGSRPAADVN